MMSIVETREVLRNYALGFPEAFEDHPWGDTVIKVGKKIFLFLGRESPQLQLSVKLPASREEALSHPFTQPAGYGLGRHGWVSATIDLDDLLPIATLKAWVDESYRAIAPKKLVKQLPQIGN